MNETPSSVHFPEEIVRFIVGDHDGLDVDALVTHLGVCDQCAREARKQAVLEVGLHEVGRASVRCPDCQRISAATQCKHCGSSATVRSGSTTYTVERVLTKNAHGRIYVAKNGHGETVALKELAFVQTPNIDALDRFDREARLLKTLVHPAIPRFIESFQVGEGAQTRLYLAQEYIEGESLLARMDHCAFTEGDVMRVARQVLNVLVYLQSLSPKVFHRDVKPANMVLRQKDGSVALVDFGSARDLGPTASATLVGTFGYMPVEQLGGIVDSTSDLYALGASMFHLLTRTEPWKLLDAEGRRRLTKNVSPALREYIEKLTAVRSSDRFTSAEEARIALDLLPEPTRANAVEVLAHRVASRVDNAMKRVMRRPRPYAIAAAVCLLFGIGGVMGLATSPNADQPPPPVLIPVPFKAPYQPPEVPEKTPPNKRFVKIDGDELDDFIEEVWQNSGDAVASELELRARYARDAVQDLPDAHIVYGKVTAIDGDETEILAASPIAKDGWYVMPVADLGGPLSFRKDGYRVLDVPLDKIKTRMARIEDQELIPIVTDEDDGTVLGTVAVQDGTRHEISGRLFFDFASRDPMDPTWDCNCARGDGMTVSVAAGHFEALHVAPGKYTVRLEAEGYAPRAETINVRKGQITRPPTIVLDKLRPVEMLVRASNADHRFDGAEPWEAIRDATDEDGSPDVDIKQSNGVIYLACRHCKVSDMGVISEQAFRELTPDPEKKRWAQDAPIPIMSGHTYLIKRRDESLLVRTTVP